MLLYSLILVHAPGSAPELKAKSEPGIIIKSGQKIGFMGDSITAQGNTPSGYIGMVIYALKVEGVEATAIPAGIPGHTSANMRGRLDAHVLSKGVDWMTLSCGVNDIMMQKKGHGVVLEDYKKNVITMVEAAQAKNVKVIILTPTPLGEDLASESNKQMAGYVEFLLSYAKEKSLPVANINAAFQEHLKTPIAADEKPGSRLLADGVHPNQTGQALMAKTVVLAMGVPAAEMPKIEQAWLNNPQGKAVKLDSGTNALISMKQYLALEAKARQQHKTSRGIVGDLWKRAIEEYNAKAGAQADPAKAAAAAQERIGQLVDEALKAMSAGK